MKDSSHSDCPFCSLSDQDVLASTQHAVAVSSRLALRPGHLVVAPREHVEALGRLSADAIGDLMQLLANALVAAEQASPAERYYVLRVGDRSPHLHFHLVPRMPGDANLGQFIFGDTGWAATLHAIVEKDGLSAEGFVAEFKRAFLQRP